MAHASEPNVAASDAPSSVDPAEAAHFGALAADWWDPKGSSAMLHRLNPVRLAYLRDRIDQHWGLDETGLKPLAGKDAADVGCGAGLLAEPLARLGARVTGIDAAPENIAAARDHSARMGGASWLTTLRRSTIPLLKPGIFAGWILLFVIFLRELSISVMLYSAGTETLSVGVYYLSNFENEPLTCALSMAQTVVLVVCFLIFRRVAGREALTA